MQPLIFRAMRLVDDEGRPSFETVLVCGLCVVGGKMPREVYPDLPVSLQPLADHLWDEHGVSVLRREPRARAETVEE